MPYTVSGLGAGLSQTVSIPISSAGTAVTGWHWVAPAACKVTSAKGMYSVANGAALTVKLRKGGSSLVAVTAGDEILAAGTSFDFNSNVDTLVSKTLHATAANLVLAAGNKIGIEVTGTPTSLVGGVIVIEIQYDPQP